MNQGESIIVSAEALKSLREMRYNPSRNITASKLGSILDAFEYGEIREGAMLFEQIAERDDTLKSVKPKREKSVSGLTAVYEVDPAGGALGEEQQDVLKKFWGSVRATNAYDRNVSGGLRLFIQQIMAAVSFRYAVHHIVWSPRASGLTATFEQVPLWLFENKTGRLRFLKNPYDTIGQDMEPGEWMVTAGEGLMIACSIGWLAKRETYNDWLIFSSRFSTPGVLGRTRHAKGTPEGEAMKQATLLFGRDLKAVVYGDDGTIKDPIQLVQADGSPNGQPMPALIERVDRKFAALYRGADLGTMSAGSGEGSGASLQGDEAMILLEDDRNLVEEKLAEISRMVLEWHYGADVEIFAAVKLKTKEEMQVASDQSALSSGGKKAGVRPEAANAEEVVSDQSAVSSDEGMEDLMSLLQADFADVAAVIERALQASGSERASLLQEAEAMLPEKIGNEAFDDEVTRLLTEAFLGQGEEVENADRGKPLGYFFSNGIRRPIYAAKYGTPLSVKWQSQTMSYSKQAGSIMAAITAEKNKEQGAAFSMGRVDEAVAAKVLEATSAHGEPRDIKNFEWRIDSDFVAHARKYHPNLTDDDFLRIPQMIAKAPVILPGESTAGLPSINFKIKRSEREFLLVGVQLNKQGQVAMRTLKKSAQGKSLL